MQKIQQVNLRESDIQENMEIRVQRADMEAKTIYPELFTEQYLNW